jgi:hypothetical protein
VHLHTLFDDPAAAVGLGGRSTGISATAQGDLARRLWGAAELSYDRLSIEVPGQGATTNGRIDATATLGVRLTRGDVKVPERVGVHVAALPGLVGPDLEGEPAESRGPLVQLWVSYQGIRLLDDKRLATLIPVGESFDYLTLGARADFHLAPGAGAKIEGYLGTELGQSDTFFGAEAGVAFRTSRALEFSCLAGYGRALGRTGDDDSFRFRLGLTYRW